MFKKSIAVAVTTAVLVAGPGHLTLDAAAQTLSRGNVGGVSATPALQLSNPTMSAPSVDMSLAAPTLGGAIQPSFNGAMPTVPSALNAVIPAASKAVTPTALKVATPAASKPVAGAPSALAVALKPAAVIESKDAKVGVEQKGAALNSLFENSVSRPEALEVAGSYAASVESGLGRSAIPTAKSVAAVENARVEKGEASGGLVSLAKRAWNVVLGWIGLGVKKAETPQVLAQRIIDQLNAQKPVYNQKVADASTLVEKMKLQIEGDEKKVAELERNITAILSDSDPNNDVMASGMINSQKTLKASIESTKEQLALAETTLAHIKDERAKFFAEREEMLAKISARMTTLEAAKLNEDIAKLKGGFQIGDLKDNMDKLDQAIDDQVAKSKGTVDSVESNPDEILKKAKDSLKSQEIQDEIARRKAEIEKTKAEKGKASGAIEGKWLYIKIAAGAAGLLLGLALVPQFVMAQVLGQIGGAFVMSLFFGKSDAKLDVILYASAVALMIAVPLLAPADMIVKAVGMVGTGYFLMLLFGPDRLKSDKGDKKGKGDGSGLLLELGIGAAVIGVIAAVSAPFRNLLKRMWNVVLGWIGLGVKAAETPEVLAQRIIDQLNEQKPIYNQKVADASTLVEKIRLQIEAQTKQSAELDRSVTAILSDSDPNNDVMAESLLNQKKTVDGSIKLNTEQLEVATKALENIKQERVRFFSEREEMLAKISARMNTLKAAKLNEDIAKLKGGFQIGDLKDNMDKLDAAIDDQVAKSKGAVDSVESNPDEILKKAKDSLKNQEVQDEIARRKAEIEKAKAEKGKSSGDASQSKALGYLAKVIGIGFALISPWISSAVFAVLGLVAIAMSPEQGKWFGRQLAVIGLGTLGIGLSATFLVAKLGLTLGAFGVGMSFIVPAGIALAVGVIATLRARGKVANAVAAAAATPAGASVVTAPAQTEAQPTEKKRTAKEVAGKAWDSILGALGKGVDAMETPEVLAQRLIDQLNDAKLEYNRKVRDASALVSLIDGQIAKETAKIAEFDRTIDRLLTDNDPTNDIQAAGLLNAKKTLEASVEQTKSQLVDAKKALEHMQQERASFFAERQNAINHLLAGMNAAKAAEFKNKVGSLQTAYEIGDVGYNTGKFDEKVAEKTASANATASTPDELLKQAKDSLRTQDIQDELAKRKAALEEAKKDKGGASGAAIHPRIWAGALLGAALEAAAVYFLGWTAVFPVLAAMTRAGMVAGILGTAMQDGKLARIAGVMFGGLVGASVAPTALPILVGMAAGLAVADFFAAVRKPKFSFGDAIGSLFAGMIVGLTLPAWLGAIGAKKSLDYQASKASNDEKGDAAGRLLPNFSRTPYGSYQDRVTRDGRKVRVYGWSLSPNTWFQAVVLGLVAGPIVWALGMATLPWAIGGMFFAPILVDALKPTWIDMGPADDGKGQSSGLLLELGIGAAVIAVIAAVSAPFRNLLKRMWNVMLGWIGLGVKAAETPEVLAQRIIDQLNEQKPIYNQKVADASTLVEKIRLQIEAQTKQSAELDRSVTAILSDSDPNNDVMAESLLNQKKTVDGSIKLNTEQLEVATKALENIKQERVRFFSEREEMLAKISARMNTLKAAKLNEDIAKLKGGFQIGDLKDNMDKLDAAIDDQVAKSKGAVDSVESNPDEILKKAKDSLKNQEVQDEIARRKAEIEKAKAEKGKSSGALTGGKVAAVVLGAAGVVLGAGLMFAASTVLAALGGMTLLVAGGVSIAAATRSSSSSDEKGDASGALGAKRDLTMKEVLGLNGAGIAAAVVVGVLTHSFWLGLGLTYVAAIPLMWGYVALRNAFGAGINAPRFSFAPSFTWAGKSYGPGAKDDKGDASGALGDETVSGAQAEAGVLSKTYNWMTLGLGITAAVAQAAYMTGFAAVVMSNPIILIGLIVAQLALVIGLGWKLNKLSPAQALGGFLVYAALNGAFLAPLLAIYTAGSVAAAFVVSAAMFGVMAVIGHTTKKNLNSVGSFGMMALTGIILASVANFFLHSTGLGMLLTYASVLVFVGLTAYDAQKIKEMAQAEGRMTKDDVSRVAVMGALTLYLDFINLFINILKILGKAKSRD